MERKKIDQNFMDLEQWVVKSRLFVDVDKVINGSIINLCRTHLSLLPLFGETMKDLHINGGPYQPKFMGIIQR